MKHKLFWILTLLMPLTCLAQEVESGLKFKDFEISLGEIKEAGGTKTVEFEYKNESKKAVVITDVVTTCGCTEVEFSKKPLKPSEKRVLKVTFDPMYRPGHFDKKIVVYSNNRKSKDILTLKGKVKAMELTVEDKYPFNLGGGILASTSSLDFNYINLGRKHTSSLDIYNNSGKVVSFSTPEVTDDLLFSYYLTNSILEPGESAQLIVTFDLREEVDYKVYKQNIPIFVSGENIKTGTGVDVMAISVPRPGSESYREDQIPVMEIPETYYFFKNAKKGDDLRHRFQITNQGTGELVIRQVLSTNPKLLAYSMSTNRVSGEKTEYIEAILNLDSDSQGRINEQLIIITNDPSLPVIEVRVSANLK